MSAESALQPQQENGAQGRFRAAIATCRRHLTYAAVFSALLNLLFAVPMLYMLQVYDRVLTTRGHMTLIFLSLFLLLGLLTLSLLDFTRSRLLVRAGVRVDNQLSATIVEASLAAASAGDQRGARQSLREFDALRQALAGPVALTLFDAPWTPIYLLIALLIHPIIGLVTLLGAVVLLLFGWRNERATRDRTDRASAMAADAYTAHGYAAGAADVVEALGMRRAMVAGQVEARTAMLTLQTQAGFITTGWAAASKFARLLLQSLALGVAAYLAITDRISVGAIIASTFIVGRALAPIDQLIGAWKTVLSARTAYRSLAELLDKYGQPPPPRTKLSRPEGRLQVEQVSVAVGTDRHLLHGVSFAAAPGEVIGIIGPSGAGKSTLARVIAGAGRVDDGTIRLDGAAFDDWDPQQRAAEIGYMPQEASLLAGTVKENICRFENRLNGESQALDDRAIEAATLAGAHDLILHLPGAYDYELGLGGRGLSVGQAQRIGLARAVYGAPRYLILDEPNAHLDAEGDGQLISTLERLKRQGTTILIVAHRLSLLPVIDKLLLLREGRVALFGPKQQVLERIRAGRGPRPVVSEVS